MNLWKHQRQEDIVAHAEKGGGEVNVIEEDAADISQMYARMVANGMIGATVMHSAGQRMDESRALALMNNAKKAPQYMDISEKNRILKRVTEQAQELEAIKEERSKFNGNE